MENFAQKLHKEGFLTTKLGDKINTMTIGWSSLGYIWGKPVLTVMVRKSRYTYELIEQSHEFTVTFPEEEAKEALGICGSKSGRQIDKLKEANINTLASKILNTPVLDMKGQHYECRIVYKQEMTSSNLDTELKDKWYKTDDFHVLYFGEILAQYKTE